MTIRAIFPGRILARISILPKISRNCLCLRVQTDRCLASVPYFFQTLSRYLSKQYRNPGQEIFPKIYGCEFGYRMRCEFGYRTPLNKALHVSRLVRPVTEYSAKQGSSGFSKEHLPGMDAGILLLVLKQGTRSLEGYIAEYLALANGSELPDCVLIGFFCDGLNQPLKSKVIHKGPHSSLSKFFGLCFVNCVGSVFTVGVAEELTKWRRQRRPYTKWPPQQHAVMSLLPVMSQVKSQLIFKSQVKL